MKKALLISLGAVILVVIISFSLLFSYMFEPAYYEAKKNCYEDVQKGMTYQEVVENVGHLFIDIPSDGVDEAGNGKVQLHNDVKTADATCVITFENNEVIFNEILFVFL